MTHDDIAQIPKNHTVTYSRVVVDFHPQKSDPHHIRITTGVISSINPVSCSKH
jgi:hypothetical protein